MHMSGILVSSGSRGSNILPTGTWAALEITNQPAVNFCVCIQAVVLTSLIFSSALVVWVQEQLKTFAEMFRKQVYTVDVKPDVVQEATAIAQIQGRKV